VTLTGRQIRHLRALGNGEVVTLVVGKNGITEAVLDQLAQCFNTRELVKVKISERDPAVRQEMAEELARRSGTELVQVLGRTVLLYREAPEGSRISSRITLPAR